MEHIHKKKAEGIRFKTLHEQAEARRNRSKAAHERKLARQTLKNAEMFSNIEDVVPEEES